MQEGLVFSSRAYLYTYQTNDEEKTICMDAGLASLVSKSYRMVALIYPPEACRENPIPSAPVIEAEVEASTLFRRLVGSCFEAKQVYTAWKKRHLLLRLFSPPTLQEVESGEAYHAMIVCSEAGLWAARMVSAVPAWLWYRSGTMEWRRLEALARIDEQLYNAVFAGITHH